MEERRVFNAEALRNGKMTPEDVELAKSIAKSQLESSLVDKNGKMKRAMVTRCWEWKGDVGSDGYGRLVAQDGERHLSMPVFYWVWMLAGGPLLVKGFHVHHLCHNRMCANPNHLAMMVAHGHMCLSGMVEAGMCSRGHLFDEVNPYIDPDGRRRCRICADEDREKYEDKKVHV